MSPGSSNVSIKAFIKRVYHFTSFIHDNNEKFVQNLMISDDSGTIRLTL